MRATEDRDRKSRRSVGREGVEQTSGRALGHGERGRVFEEFFCKKERRQVVAVTGSGKLFKREAWWRDWTPVGMAQGEGKGAGWEDSWAGAAMLVPAACS